MHAIFRALAFETIFAMILLTAPVWFVKPFAFHQVFSWIFLLLSLIFAYLGFQYVIIKGKPKGYFENTTNLIETGIFEYIRHPMYTSLILLGIGIFIKQMNLYNFLLLLANTVFLFLTATWEENELVEKFGTEYQLYRARTKMFLPFII